MLTKARGVGKVLLKESLTHWQVKLSVKPTPQSWPEVIEISAMWNLNWGNLQTRSFQKSHSITVVWGSLLPACWRLDDDTIYPRLLPQLAKHLLWVFVRFLITVSEPLLPFLLFSFLFVVISRKYLLDCLQAGDSSSAPTQIYCWSVSC